MTSEYKFECLKSIIDSNIDLLLISETKLNDSFPNSQFLMSGFHPPYREDRTDRGGGGRIDVFLLGKIYLVGRLWLPLRNTSKLYFLTST